MSSNKAHLKGMRIIAVFEALKAIFLLVVGLGLLSLVHRDVEATAVDVVKHLRLNPAHKYPRIFVEVVKHVSSTEIWLLAFFALFDSVIRAFEAVGLWMGREWGKWLGIVTAVLFLPIEIYEMWVHLTWIKTAAFITNIAIVVYLTYALNPTAASKSAELN